MSEVKRYTLWMVSESGCELEPYSEESPDGLYVHHADYAALEAECERLREALEHCLDVMKDPWKHGEGCISRAIYMADAALAASTGQGKE